MMERYVVPKLEHDRDPLKNSRYDDHIIVLNDGITTKIPATSIYDRTKFEAYDTAIMERVLHKCEWLPPGDIRADFLPPDADDLSAIHRRIVRFIRKYVWLADDDSYDLVANWVISTYFRETFQFAPFLILDGVTVSGKSTMLKTLNQLVYHGVHYSNYSAAALARIIETSNTTLLLDEIVGNLQGDRGAEIFELLKASYEAGGILVRADSKSQKIHKNAVFTHIALAVKAEGLPEDVYNRGIRINMIGVPEGVKLGDIYNLRDDDVMGELNPIGIRTDLYALRWAYLGGVSYDKFYLDFAKYMRTTDRHLDDVVEAGEWKGKPLYAFINEIRDPPIIQSRAKNIALTLYSISQMTGSEKPTIKLIADSIKANREVIIDTHEAITFIALVDAFFAKRNVSYAYDKAKVVDDVVFDHVMRDISTTDVANAFNRILTEQGNAGRDPVSTKTVTSKILSLGFEYKRRTGNKSYFIPDAVNFKGYFMRYLKMWMPEEAKNFDLRVN